MLKYIAPRSLRLTANGGDALSGIGGGEYFIDTDPGVGNGARMNASATTAVTTVNTQF